MLLRKYTDSDFPILKSWITDPELLFLFAANDWSFPLQFDEIKNYQLAHPQKQFYLLCNDENQPIAFGELISGDAHSPRLGRLLVGGTENRGKGIGKILIQQMIAASKLLNSQNYIHLFVLTDNLPAIRCYENLGFQFHPQTQVSLRSPNGLPKIARLMTLHFDD